MSKFWLTLTTQNREKDIEELTQCYDLFDGIVATVNLPSNDKTLEILESRKKAGKIITQPFVKHHGHLMNGFLFAGIIKNLDYFIILDSPNRITSTWQKTIREDIENWRKNNIGAVFMDRIYVARYLDSMEFSRGIHWGLSPLNGKVINMSQYVKNIRNEEYKQENYVLNTRDKLVSGFINPIKYFFSYGSNSQTELLYRQFGDEIWNKHEEERMNFRIYCEQYLNIPLTLEGLKNYLIDKVSKYPTNFENYLEFEVNIKDAFRLFVLKQPWIELHNNRFDWSYFHWKKTGEIIQDKTKTGYLGIFNKYKIAKGETPE